MPMGVTMSTCIESDFLTVIETNPLLCERGWWAPVQARQMKVDLESSRNALKSCFDEFKRSVQWLSQCQTTKMASINSPSSYTLKHFAEKATGNYISNGALITAAIYLNIPLKTFTDSPNPGIGISRRCPVYMAAERS